MLLGITTDFVPWYLPQYYNNNFSQVCGHSGQRNSNPVRKQNVNKRNFENV